MKTAINYFSRVLVVLVLCAGLMVTGCAKINDALEGHGNRLDNLEGVQIKNLKEQVSSINVSLKDLQAVDANLQKLIDDLESEAADLQTQLDANSAADAATKKALEDEIANIKTLIEALQAKDAELDQKIADLKTYVDSELKSTEDWANATFATLSQYTAVQTEISAIKALLEHSGIDIGADLSAIQQAIEDAIAASETSMKGWVNTTLAEGYYNIAAIDGKIAALNIAITEGDEALAADIAELTSKLDQAKADLTTAYQTAIETAINDNNGVIRGEIADAITEAIEGVDTKLQAINASISDLQAEIALLKQGIASINEQISGINTSLDLLETMDETLQGYIDALETKAEELEQKLEANSSADASTKKALEDEIANIKALIEALQAKDAELDQKISDLKTYVDNELKGTEDWANATFATLAQYTAVQTEISAIKALLEQNGGDIEADLSAIQQAIGDAIEASETSMKGWVNTTLAEGYYNIAAIDGKIAALNIAITEGDEALAADIAELTSKLNQAKADLTTAYQTAIETAINDNNGVIRGEIADAITEAIEGVDAKLQTINTAIADLQAEIELLKQGIASINEQISGINTSLGLLETMDETLQGYIDALESKAEELEQKLEANSSADAATKKALEDEIASIKALITALQSKDAELDQKIADLKTYVDNELKSTEDWAEATFATLTQYESVQTEIAAIKALIEQYKTEITSAYTKAIEDAIAASEASMKSWVSEVLAEGYYDIATTEGKLTSLQNELLASDNILAEQIVAQQTALEQAKSELTEAYKAAIEESINTNSGVIRGEMATAIAEAKEELETKISAIETRITEIESRLSGVEQKIEEILSMIQSVVYMPEYSDGVTYVDATEKTAEMSFKISPSSAVAALEDVWSQALSVKYITTAITKAAPLMKDLSITSSEFDDNLGTVSLVVDCANLDDTFFEGSSRASAALFISDGTTSVSSEFISILPSFGIDEDLSYTSDITSLSLTPDVTSVTFTGTVLHPTIGSEVGIFYSTDPYFTVDSASKISTFEFDSQKGFSIVVPSEWINMQYYYCLFTVSDGAYKYGKIKTFSTKAVSASSASVEVTYEDDTVVFDFISGIPERDSGLEYGIIYSRETTPTVDNSTKLVGDFNNSRLIAADLYSEVTYYYRIYYSYNGEYVYGDITTFVLPLVATNLSSSGTANCYIVSESGPYKFRTVKGNSSTTVGKVTSAAVLWESFGTDIVPTIGDLIHAVSFKDGYISFQTNKTFKEGNAVIAAKDAFGNILWSWHIWLTDQPQGQVYYNSAGTMMDRNLGATSATPGDVGALGLLYQWGRKDPFLGSSLISSSTLAKSTITWPSPVSSTSSTGTVDYVTSHPTTFVTASSSPYDWHYSSRDNTLWTTSGDAKSIYDPCPAGWRVPDGGSNGIWSKAGFDDTTYDSTNEGISFSISSPSTTWYPASGFRYNDRGGGLAAVGGDGHYWSASPDSNFACYLSFFSYGYVYPSSGYYRAFGYSVRCLQESK